MEGNELMNSRWGFITFRAHVSEPQLFEDFINIFLPILNNFEQYAYSIEEDNTPNRHIHAILSLNSSIKDKSKLDQKFNNKFMKDFKKSLGIRQTDWAHAYDSKYLPHTSEDVLKVLGYVLKDDKVTRRRVKNISTNLITQGIKFHVSTARIDNSRVKNDWKAIKPQNIHVFLEDFMTKNNIDVNDTELVPLMVKSKYTFNQITSKQLKLSIAELKYQIINNDEENFENLITIQNHTNDANPKIDELMEENMRLKEELENYEAKKIQDLNIRISDERKRHKFQISQKDKQIKLLQERLAIALENVVPCGHEMTPA